MTDDWADLSDAVVLYLGRGRSPIPVHDADALNARYGHERASLLEARIVVLLQEVHSIQVDWASETMNQASERARLHVRGEHPGWSEEAVEALGWEFDWSWR